MAVKLRDSMAGHKVTFGSKCLIEWHVDARWYVPPAEAENYVKDTRRETHGQLMNHFDWLEIYSQTWVTLLFDFI